MSNPGPQLGVKSFNTRQNDVLLLKADVTATGLAAADIAADAAGAAAAAQSGAQAYTDELASDIATGEGLPVNLVNSASAPAATKVLFGDGAGGWVWATEGTALLAADATVAGAWTFTAPTVTTSNAVGTPAVIVNSAIGQTANILRIVSSSIDGSGNHLLRVTRAASAANGDLAVFDYGGDYAGIRYHWNWYGTGLVGDGVTSGAGHIPYLAIENGNADGGGNYAGILRLNMDPTALNGELSMDCQQAGVGTGSLFVYAYGYLWLKAGTTTGGNASASANKQILLSADNGVVISDRAFLNKWFTVTSAGIALVSTTGITYTGPAGVNIALQTIATNIGAFSTFTMNTAGQMAWGPGTAATDTTFSRAGIGMLQTPGGLIVGNVALATNAITGFLYIPQCAGAPTNAPAARGATSPMVYDTTNNKIWVYNGAWRGIVVI